jgi:hypothetical protein
VDPAPAKAATKGIFVVDTERKGQFPAWYSSRCPVVIPVSIGYPIGGLPRVDGR